MQLRALGRTGLQVSRLALGTMTWGSGTDEHDAREQLMSFVDAGGTLVDTAHIYSRGASEELVGALLNDVVPRDDIVLATKCGLRFPGGRRTIGASRSKMLGELDTSLKRLRVDSVDLWQVHVWDDVTPIEETLAALDHAVTTGRAAYVGISNYSGWQTAQAATWQHAVPGRTPLASTQVEYSLLAREVETEVLPAAGAMGMGVLTYSPLAGGVLTGKYRGGTPSDSRGAQSPDYLDRYLDDRGRGVVEAVLKASDGLGWSPLEVAISWVRDRPGVTAPIIGARTNAHLKAALAAEDKQLPPEIVEALDDVSGGG